MGDFITQSEARELVETYMEKESKEKVVSVQQILDSGAIPALKGYKVRPGKVSASISGGHDEYEIEKKDASGKKTIEKIDIENPPLNAPDETPLRIMTRTANISTHDVIRGTIPFKDQILATNHNYMRKLLSGAIGTSQYEVAGLSDNSIVIAAENLEQIRFENVTRAYMAKTTTKTSLYHNYINKGKRTFCGHKLQDNLIINGPLPYVMDTPSTKSDIGDESLSPRALFKRGICTPAQYAQIRNGSLVAFGMARQILDNTGVLLVDWKLEHGINRKGQIVSQDEIVTMDSSRFWLKDDYEKQMALFLENRQRALADYLLKTQPGIKEEDYLVNFNVVICPKSYSKEFARGFSKGKEGYTDEQRVEIAVRYIEGIQHLLGKRFEPDMRPTNERMITGLEKVVEEFRLAA